VTTRLVVFAPNWLGDAVMALPALADVRQHLPNATVVVAARSSIAPLFTMVPGINGVIALEKGDRGVEELRRPQFEAALLLPNSFNTARMAWRAGIRDRWGYRADFRTLLLTRSVAAPTRLHQTEYYRHLVRALGFGGASAIEPRIELTDSHREAGRALLSEQGWAERTPLVAVAPGAAFGGAKRWPVGSFAALIDGLMHDGLRSVLIGAPADRAAATEVLMAATASPAALNLVGRTDLPTLGGVLAQCRSLVTNDSGAMHFAAALGLPVIAMFGPTRERETYPIGDNHAVLTHQVWCRPCMLKECPLTHRCMTGIGVDAVLAATRARV
jgi:lipopolysaccharide heptosyltransferase II